MKMSCLGLLAVLLVLDAGCKPDSSGSIGPEDAKQMDDTDNQLSDTFHLTVPYVCTFIRQGETKAVSIGIKRGKSFDREVALTFSGLPIGVTLEPGYAEIRTGDTDAKFMITAADDAS